MSFILPALCGRDVRQYAGVLYFVIGARFIRSNQFAAGAGHNMPALCGWDVLYFIVTDCVSVDQKTSIPPNLSGPSRAYVLDQAHP